MISISNEQKVENLLRALKGKRLNLRNEKVTQHELAVKLTTAGLTYRREVSLDENRESIIDFMVSGSIGVEVKLKGQPARILDQCERYCGFDEITHLVLVTNKAMGMPNTLQGKPVYVFNLATAWL